MARFKVYISDKNNVYVVGEAEGNDLDHALTIAFEGDPNYKNGKFKKFTLLGVVINQN